MTQNQDIAALRPGLRIAGVRLPNLHGLVVALAPLVAALVVGGIILLMLGVDPLKYYGFVVERGLLRPRGLQETLTRTIPLMLIGAALIVSFRASIWNLGVDGQFLLGTFASAVVLPSLVEAFPHGPGLAMALVVGAVVGAAWTIVPALLRAYQGVNEVISTLMMTFIATALGSALIKLVFRNPGMSEPQTTAIPVEARMPHIPGTTINIGIFLALAVLIGVHLMMTRTSLGLRLQVVGLNVKAATHAGMSLPKLTLLTFAISGALAGLGGAAEVVGVLGQMRADWNPGYGFAVVPLVFLARMNGWAVIAFIFAFSMLDIGSESAAVRLNVPQYFNLVLVGFILLFMALTEYLDQQRRWRTE